MGEQWKARRNKPNSMKEWHRDKETSGSTSQNQYYLWTLIKFSAFFWKSSPSFYHFFDWIFSIFCFETVFWPEVLKLVSKSSLISYPKIFWHRDSHPHSQFCGSSLTWLFSQNHPSWPHPNLYFWHHLFLNTSKRLRRWQARDFSEEKVMT